MMAIEFCNGIESLLNCCDKDDDDDEIDVTSQSVRCPLFIVSCFSIERTKNHADDELTF